MAQLPFFIGALGDDHIVPLGALLREVGDQLAFVFDFGDWECCLVRTFTR